MAWVAGILGGLFGEEVIAGGMLTELFGDFSLVTEGGLEEALFGEAGGGLPMILEEEVVPEVVEAVPEIAGGGMVPEIAGGGVVPEVAGEGMLPEGTVEATGEGVMPIEMPETARTAKEWFMDVTPSFVTQTDPRWIPAVVAPPAIAGGIVGGVGSNAGLKRSWMLSRAVTRLATSAGGLTAGMGLHGHEGVERSLTLPGMVVQLDASNDIHRLPHFNGLEVNMVDMPAGTAMFSSAGDELHKGFEPVKGLINGADAKPYRGVHVGNLSFIIPGLTGPNEMEMEIEGNWITTSLSKQEETDAEVEQRFSKFYDVLRKGMQKNGEKVKTIMLAS
ncbi:hypothetical protein LTR09_005150 [Extremus antarcticus]|uniref:Uncharacterized protein n=1 Tax=Extremus antarcticus TaxID=702011 RepID=A0AAJ0DGW1_9PEZI|nr:hypothetical protein LTR09_005150 [Extremus antarcticus]